MRQYVWLDEPCGEIGPLRIAKRYYSMELLFEGFESKEVVAEDEVVVQEVVVGDALLAW